MILLLIATVVLGYFVLFYVNEIYQKIKIGKKIPPGPWPLPLIGNLHQLAMADSRPDLGIAKLAEKYGDLCRLRLGSTETVIMTTHEAVRSILLHKDAMGRDLCGTLLDRNKGQKAGILFSQGPKWEKIRMWTIKNLRDYGFNKSSSMEADILLNIDSMLEKTEKSLGSDGTGTLEIKSWFTVPVFKFIWKLLVGHCTSEEEVMLARLLDKSEGMMRAGIFGTGIINAFPFIRFIFPKATGNSIMMEFFDESYAVTRELLDQTKYEIDTPQSFLEAFVKKMREPKENKDDPTDIFNEHEFSILFMDLFQAGSDTTASFLEGIVLMMIHHPDIQAKVYKEIQATIPEGEAVSFEASKSMIYTRAVILETHRHVKVVQNFVPRVALQDIEYKDNVIPKDTVIMTDLQTMYNCPKLWKDPEAFLPERFIGPKGELINQEYVIPFSIGKRNCIAETMAEMTGFLFFVSILRTYKLSRVPGEALPRKDMTVGFTSRPFPFKFVISKRKSQ